MSSSFTPGIDEASVTRLRCDPFHIVLWVDIAHGNHESGGSDTYRFGFEESLDGRRAKWTCELVNNTCRVTIEGDSFDVANGTLFLVSTAGGKLRSRQLNHDTARIERSEEALQELARTERTIREFFTMGSNTE